MLKMQSQRHLPICNRREIKQQINTRRQIYHRQSNNECIVPLNVLHKERELGGVKGGIISYLGGIRVTATIQIYEISGFVT